MYNKRMYSLGSSGSVIREIFEYGRKRRAEIGNDRVFDFSLGNPSVPAPDEINKAIKEIVDSSDPVALHGYTTARGDVDARAAIADDLNRRFHTDFGPDELFLTMGAAASLSAVLHGLCEPDDEFIVISPFFPEYRVFIESAGGKLVDVPADRANSFAPDIRAIDRAINEHTKAVIINSPNNPTGKVYGKGEITALSELLKRRSEGRDPIFLISDEPYRELIYTDVGYPFVTDYYNNSIICYSYSKSLSLAGERIGYVLVPSKLTCHDGVYAAVAGAARALGYVCAPSLFQHVIARCAGCISDISIYDRNRKLLYGRLTELGFECVYPDGAFYLFMKSPIDDEKLFCEIAKKHELLLVPAGSFGAPGYVRISYCVPSETVEKSLPAFSALASEVFINRL